MPTPDLILIAFRPFTDITDPELLQTIANDDTIRMAQEALIADGLHAEILHVGDDIETRLRAYDPRRTLIFNYCDGFADNPSGYDPVTSTFEALGFAFTGADDATLRWSQDKALAKARLVGAGIPTPKYAIFNAVNEIHDWTLFPALVKPAHQHGSLGITPQSVVHSPAELQEQVRRIVEDWQQPALVEDFIEGDEYRVSVLGNGDALDILPLMRIRYHAAEGLKDFDTKWLEIGITIDVPVEVSPLLRERIQQAARAAFRAVDMRDYGGIDLRVRGEQPYIIDPNQNPDISEVSNFLRMSRAVGIEYPALLGRIARLAAARLPR